jgi:hypothetical protein
VLAVEGFSTTMQPYSERRALLEQLELETEWVRLVATFEDAGGAVRGGVRARPRGRRRQAGRQPVPIRETGVGENEEQGDRAFRRRT